ncbi:MAG: class I SAM-dependent methyltransferase [Candidatus Levybacteria bacterium]|nr:class I SAM-dependent methyltransferase [Candidatus Levybacteria bacterium]
MIKYQGITTLEVLTDAKNYNNWIAHEISSHVSSPTLEIGAGTGNLSKHFLQYKPLYLTDVDSGLVRLLNKRFIKEKNVFTETLDISQKPSKKYISFFASIYAINVLEHIKDDKKALKNIHEMLKKEGKLMLLVPAKKKAFTRLDKELGHYRRYEKEELTHALKKSGFAIETMYFFNIVGLLSWTVRDKVSRNKSALKPYQVRIFDSIVPVLRFIESFIKIPVGISLIVVARKV